MVAGRILVGPVGYGAEAELTTGLKLSWSIGGDCLYQLFPTALRPRAAASRACGGLSLPVAERILVGPVARGLKLSPGLAPGAREPGRRAETVPP